MEHYYYTLGKEVCFTVFSLKAKHKGESWRSSLLERLKQQLENKRMIYFKDQLELTTTVGQGIAHIIHFEQKQDILHNIFQENQDWFTKVI